MHAIWFVTDESLLKEYLIFTVFCSKEKCICERDKTRLLVKRNRLGIV